MKKTFRWDLLCCLLGTAIEWGEFTFFAYITPILTPLFFPDSQHAYLQMALLFGMSYFVRPLGALIFGSIGDKKGRKPALILSMALMGLATTLMGSLPTWDQVGVWAPVGLLVARVLQGLAVSGEFHGSAIFMFEQKTKKPFLAGSLTPFAASLGMALGAQVATFVGSAHAPSYAWRIPFLAGGVLAFLALLIRSQAMETLPQAKKRETPPTLSLAWGVALHLAMAAFVSLLVYVGSLYYRQILIRSHGMDATQAGQTIALGQGLAACLTLVFGYTADLWDGKKICLIGLIFGGLLGLGIALGWDPISLQMIYGLANGMVSGTFMTLLIQLFPPGTRYRAHSLSWSLGASIFGGSALMVSEYLFGLWGAPGPGVYLGIGALFGACAMVLPKYRT
jgi:MHS family proline/betaine transporter-like MFS transporter